MISSADHRDQWVLIHAEGTRGGLRMPVSSYMVGGAVISSEQWANSLFSEWLYGSGVTSCNGKLEERHM